MSGKSQQESQTSQTQDATVNPWANSMPALNNILSNLGSLTGNNIGPNSAQTSALGQLAANANNMPNYGDQATALANGLLTGGPDLTAGANSALNGYQAAANGALNNYTGAATGALGNYIGATNSYLSNYAGSQGAANNAYQSSLSPYLSSSYLDPTTSPGMQNVLKTIQNDVGNSVNSMFAGAGRDLSGMNQQTLARGLAQGEAAPLLAQYNQNVATQRGAQDASYGANNATSGNIYGASSGAAGNILNAAAGTAGDIYGAASGNAGNLYNAANTTTGLLSGLNQTAIGNRLQGLGIGTNVVPQAYNANANAQLAAQAQAYGLPLSNLGMLEGLTIPLAGLGKQLTGTASGNSTTTSSKSPFDMLTGLFSGGQNSPISGMAGTGLGILGLL